VSGTRGVTAVLAFGLEIAMLAAFAVWSLDVGQPALLGLGLLIVVDGAVIAVWGTWLAPRARRRLPLAPRVAVELVLELVSALALWAAGQAQLAVTLAVLIVLRFGLGLTTGADREGT
jgi:hypothetical protein